jgi:hypothetical protein
MLLINDEITDKIKIIKKKEIFVGDSIGEITCHFLSTNYVTNISLQLFIKNSTDRYRSVITDSNLIPLSSSSSSSSSFFFHCKKQQPKNSSPFLL